MSILYEWPLDWPIWAGTAEEAKAYWSEDRILPKGKYVMISDFSGLSDLQFTLVKASTDLRLTLDLWLGKGLDKWEWKDRKLYVYMTEASPAIPIIVYYIILAIIAVIGLVVAAYIFTEVRVIFQEMGVGGKILLAGIGVSLIGGTIVSLAR